MSLQTITLAGGCFWCTEAVFQQLRGVLGVRSGYANGRLPNPSYAQVCEGDTGHAEAVQVVFDPEQVSLQTLLEVFFHTHDPTTLNRQGHDVGTQYRSGIYWSEPGHEAIAREVHAQADAALDGRVVTELAPLGCFYPAEAEHQDYYLRHPQQGYCAAVIGPKVEKFRRSFTAALKV